MPTSGVCACISGYLLITQSPLVCISSASTPANFASGTIGFTCSTNTITYYPPSGLTPTCGTCTGTNQIIEY